MLRLASASPRRRQLLDADRRAARGDAGGYRRDAARARERADRYVMRLAREKAERRLDGQRDLPVLGADTTVVIDGAILGKPESEADATGHACANSRAARTWSTPGIALRAADGRDSIGIATTTGASSRT